MNRLISVRCSQCTFPELNQSDREPSTDRPFQVFGQVAPLEQTIQDLVRDIRVTAHGVAARRYSSSHGFDACPGSFVVPYASHLDEGHRPVPPPHGEPWINLDGVINEFEKRLEARKGAPCSLIEAILDPLEGLLGVFPKAAPNISHYSHGPLLLKASPVGSILVFCDHNRLSTAMSSGPSGRGLGTGSQETFNPKGSSHLQHLR